MRLVCNSQRALYFIDPFSFVVNCVTKNYQASASTTNIYWEWSFAHILVIEYNGDM